MDRHHRRQCCRPDTTRSDITRNLIGPNRASVTIIFDEPHQLHRIRDPEAGDDLLVVTGFAPARGFINEQDFVEFRALASTQGVVIEPLADDISVDFAHDKIVVAAPARSDVVEFAAKRAAWQRVTAVDVRCPGLGARPRVEL